jgi:hypothetical protein
MFLFVHKEHVLHEHDEYFSSLKGLQAMLELEIAEPTSMRRHSVDTFI